MIAEKDGNVDWLDKVPNPLNSDYGYADFYRGVDTTIQGYNTFAHVRAMGIDNPYPETTNYVYTGKKDHKQVEGFSFISDDHVTFTRHLKAGEGKDIWLIGGGQLNSLMLENGLIDEIWNFVMPVIIPDGIRLFATSSMQTNLRLKESVSYSSGVVCLKYLIKS